MQSLSGTSAVILDASAGSEVSLDEELKPSLPPLLWRVCASPNHTETSAPAASRRSTFYTPTGERTKNVERRWVLLLLAVWVKDARWLGLKKQSSSSRSARTSLTNELHPSVQRSLTPNTTLLPSDRPTNRRLWPRAGLRAPQVPKHKQPCKRSSHVVVQRCLGSGLGLGASSRGG